MDLKTFFFGLPQEEREMFARKCSTSVGHIRNVAYGDRTASVELAVSIERESGGQVNRVDMFPDSYQLKWPELADPKTPAPDLNEAKAA